MECHAGVPIHYIHRDHTGHQDDKPTGFRLPDYMQDRFAVIDTMDSQSELGMTALPSVWNVSSSEEGEYFIFTLILLLPSREKGR